MRLCCRLLPLAVHSWVIRTELRLWSKPLPFYLRHLLAGALPGPPVARELVGWWFCSPGHGQSHYPISYQTMSNSLCCFIVLLSHFSVYSFHLLSISAQMSEGWTEDAAAHVFAFSLYGCKQRCKVKGEDKLCTLGQVASLYRQHWFITDINSLINFMRL